MSDGDVGAARSAAGDLRELVKSVLGFSWAMSLFGLRSLANLLAPARAAASLEAVKQAAAGELGAGLRGAFQAADQIQRQVVDGVFAVVPGGGAPGPGGGGGMAPGAGGAGGAGGPGAAAGERPAGPPPPSGSLDTATFVVLGEGLAAGTADFGTSSDLQREGFPAQMARQMQTGFAQALLQPPGIGNLPGMAPLPVLVPAWLQTTVLESLDVGTAALGNFAVPGFRLADALHLRPAAPLVHREDARQTAANLVLGMPGLLQGARELPTQLEAALARRPTFALVELGYLEAVEAAVGGDAAGLPGVEDFRRDLRRLLAELRQAGAAVLVMNVPDPVDAACASSVAAAAEVLNVPPAVLVSTYGLEPGDRITPRGLFEIGYQLLSRGGGPLPAGAVLRAETAARIGERVREWNGEVAALAREHGAAVCDLHALWRMVQTEGVAAGPRHLTAGYLGGFYSLNGYYPGKTGHALIANQALRLLNQTFGAEFPLIDLARVAATDPVVLYQPAAAGGPAAGALPPGAAPGASPPGAGMGASGGMAPPAPGAIGGMAPPATPASGAGGAGDAGGEGGLAAGHAADGRRRPRGAAAWPPPAGCTDAAPLPRPIVLPPGLEVVLELNPETSYFGDALRAVDCLDPAVAASGSCGGVLFGGLALMDSHLHGQVRLRFSPPVGDFARFELTVGALRGDDGILAAPQLYKLPGQQQVVQDFPGMVSWGVLQLSTGMVTGVGPGTYPEFNFSFLNTALLALIRVNPNFPKVPISFPGQYGSAWACFGQRPDGQLDFELFGTTFLPLGASLPPGPGGQVVRFPLPFAGPGLQFASVPTRGLALHPHIYLSTREPQPPAADVPEIPTNTVREFTCFTHNTAFGDVFGLVSPVLGGPATGRSQLVGRMQVQFGEREGNSVPIYVTAMIPGGDLAPMLPSPLSEELASQSPGGKGRLSPGPLGFNATLRFPLASYGLDDVYLLSDPFDLSVAAVDVRSGAILGQQLHRGLIGQDLFFALVRVEPRTPQASFQFRGPAIFQKTASGETVYRYDGKVYIFYPPTFLFPYPNLATGFPVEMGSRLDPYFFVQAMDGGAPPPSGYVKQGGASDVLAATDDRFSYRYAIPADPRRVPAVFEYTNHSQQGSFRLQGLTWVRFGNSRTARGARGEYEVVTFAGFGIWSKEGVEVLRPATVQISTAPEAPYVGIQIDGGLISNVDTKPPNIAQVQP